MKTTSQSAALILTTCLVLNSGCSKTQEVKALKAQIASMTERQAKLEADFEEEKRYTRAFSTVNETGIKELHQSILEDHKQRRIMEDIFSQQIQDRIHEESDSTKRQIDLQFEIDKTNIRIDSIDPIVDGLAKDYTPLLLDKDFKAVKDRLRAVEIKLKMATYGDPN